MFLVFVFILTAVYITIIVLWASICIMGDIYHTFEGIKWSIGKRSVLGRTQMLESQCVWLLGADLFVGFKSGGHEDMKNALK